MIEFKHVHGRLGTLRFVPPVTVAETQQLAQEVRALIGKLAGVKLLLCTDIRTSVAFAPDVIQILIATMSTDNPAIERNGILYTHGGSMGLQVTRAIRDAKSGERRMATDSRELLEEWLAQALDAEEMSRVRAFLDS